MYNKFREIETKGNLNHFLVESIQRVDEVTKSLVDADAKKALFSFRVALKYLDEAARGSWEGPTTDEVVGKLLGKPESGYDSVKMGSLSRARRDLEYARNTAKGAFLNPTICGVNGLEALLVYIASTLILNDSKAAVDDVVEALKTFQDTNHQVILACGTACRLAVSLDSKELEIVHRLHTLHLSLKDLLKIDNIPVRGLSPRFHDKFEPKDVYFSLDLVDGKVCILDSKVIGGLLAVGGAAVGLLYGSVATVSSPLLMPSVVSYEGWRSFSRFMFGIAVIPYSIGEIAWHRGGSSEVRIDSIVLEYGKYRIKNK